MAALIGDFGGPECSPFRSRPVSSAIAAHRPASSPSAHPPPPPPPPPRNLGGPQPKPMPCPARPATHAHAASPAHPASPPLSASNSFSQAPAATALVAAAPIPTPPPRPDAAPDFASPSPPSSLPRGPRAGDGCWAPMADTDAAAATAQAASTTSTTSSSSSSSSASTADTVVPAPTAARPPPPTNAIPSPESDGDAPWASAPAPAPAPAPVPSSFRPPPAPERTQKTIRIRDLHHVQTLAQADGGLGHRLGHGAFPGDLPAEDVQFEISGMPIGDIIEMVAALLTKITTTNDQQHDALHRSAHQQRQAQAQAQAQAHGHGDAPADGGPHASSPFSASVLAFHGKNIPAITILSYLSRIHKYCPTTYEVFLSLLVYFDRMAERVNNLVVQQQQEQREQQRQQAPAPPEPTADVATATATASPDEMDEDLADSDDEDDAAQGTGDDAPSAAAAAAAAPPATYFVVDSYNIHRLIIAGVTCASKFFSDVFYTNSRYAKVGGLPLAELNHLELQFLILNDFRLAIPIEDLEAYATMLVEFYVREVVGQSRPASVS